MENPIKIDDLGTPLFSETSINLIHYVTDWNNKYTLALENLR